MGMYDTVAVSDKLPVNQEMIDAGLDINNHSFQTKDLHRCLSTFYIQGGRLFEEKYKIDTWEEDPTGKGMGRRRKEDPYLSDTQYHGKLNFYDFRPEEGWDYWIEYEATFTHGVVEKVELVQFKKTDNTAKVAQLKEIFEQAEAEQKKWYNRFFFSTIPWRWSRLQLCHVLGWIEHKCVWLRINLP